MDKIQPKDMGEEQSRNFVLKDAFFDMINLELNDFLGSDRCCMKFPSYYPKYLRNHIHTRCRTMAIKAETKLLQDGIKYVQIYKTTCNQFVPGGTPQVILSETSRQEIYKFLRQTRNALTINEKVDLTPGFIKHGYLTKPRIQIYRFSLGMVIPNVVSVPPPVKLSPKIFEKRISYPVYEYRQKFLNMLSEHQVLIICGKSGTGKSTQIPQYILENATALNEHCRIICANVHQISAINSSQLVSLQRGEKLGTVIGYQIRLKSVSSHSTNLLYSTSEFFLRCLCGIKLQEAFYGVTHVVVDDVHEREVCTDLLLYEIKRVLNYYPKLKIILMCSPTEYLPRLQEYLPISKIMNIQMKPPTNITVKYLDEILIQIKYISGPMNSYMQGDCGQNVVNKTEDARTQNCIDRLLEQYMDNGDMKYFDEFMCLVRTENASVDIQHSVYKITMLMSAAKNDKIHHVNELIKIGANTFAVDNLNRTAYDWACLQNSLCCIGCLGALNFNHELNFVENENNKEKLLYAYQYSMKMSSDSVDFALIFSIVQYIHSNCPVGSVLIFLASFEDVIRLEFIISTGELSVPESCLEIHRIHDKMQKRELDDIFSTPSTAVLRQILLCTDLAESCLTINNVAYVIDPGRCFENCDNKKESGRNLHWISREKCERRKIIIDESFDNGICFRIFSSKEMDNLPLILKPELETINLDKMCLLVKLLSPRTSIADHFDRAICKPSVKTIQSSIQLLQDIGALDVEENITILGSRLIDIPVDVKLGKVLIYAIVMQCLDPVLTIISCLAHKDPMELPVESGTSRKNVFLSKLALSEESNSDHLVLLFLFQKWQEDRVNYNIKFEQTNMSKFLLNANLQIICELRSKIVGIVRAAQLIHSQGIFSMNYINLKGDNWALVKACFVAGMYPNICRIDKSSGIIKSVGPKERPDEPILTFFDSGSVLRSLTPESPLIKSQSYQSDWFFYQKITKCDDAGKFYSLKFNTLVSPVAVLLFGGELKRCDEEEENLNVSDENENDNNNTQQTNKFNNCFVIDKWLSVMLSKDDYYLLFNLRQKFSHILLDLLENCDNQEKVRKFRQLYINKLSVLDTISSVLAAEDKALNFKAPDNVGNRPKALPLAFTSDMNLGIPGSDFEVNGSNGESLALMLTAQLKVEKNKNNTVAVNPIQRKANSLPQNAGEDSKNPQNQNNSNVTDKVRILRRPIPTENVALTLENNISMKPSSTPQTQTPTQTQTTCTKTSFERNMKCFVLKCSNQTETQYYFHGGRYRRQQINPCWFDLCQKFLDNLEQRFVVFLFDKSTDKFCAVGELKAKSTDQFDLRIVEWLMVDASLEEFKACLKNDNVMAAFMQREFCCEIPVDIAFRMFHKMNANFVEQAKKLANLNAVVKSEF